MESTTNAMEATEASAPRIKLQQPPVFKGERQGLKVKVWLYQVEKYLELSDILPGNQAFAVNYAATLLQGQAAIWWYTVVQRNAVPTTWPELREAIIKEFIPFDSTISARESLDRLYQTSTVEDYINQFRNLCLTIPDLSQGDMLHRFIHGLKTQTQMQVKVQRPQTNEEAYHIALAVDTAFKSTEFFQQSFMSGFGQGSNVPTPMEIGTLRRRRPSVFKQKKRWTVARNGRPITCFKCGKKGHYASAHQDEKQRQQPVKKINQVSAQDEYLKAEAQ